MFSELFVSFVERKLQIFVKKSVNKMKSPDPRSYTERSEIGRDREKSIKIGMIGTIGDPISQLYYICTQNNAISGHQRAK